MGKETVKIERAQGGELLFAQLHTDFHITGLVDPRRREEKRGILGEIDVKDPLRH
jgi:hypothetical protein